MKNRLKQSGLAVVLALSLSAAVANAVPVLDQEYDPIGGVGILVGQLVDNTQSVAQTFTVGLGGLLSRVDLMLSRGNTATGTFTVSILSTTGGVPVGSGNVLFSQTFPVTALPDFNTGIPTFMPVNVSSAIVVSPGAVLAVAVTYGGSGPGNGVLWLSRFNNNAYPNGAGYTGDGDLSTSWSLIPDDLGFRTFVEVLPPALIISPPSGDYVTTQGFDLVLIADAPGLTVVGGSAFLDSVDKTIPLVNCILLPPPGHVGTLVSGGQTFRCPGLTGGTFGSGSHTLSVTITFNDGSSVSDTVTWNVRANTEP